jgi:hypothetical protein
MRGFYRFLSFAMAAAVIVQAAAIAYGVFGLAHDVDAGVVVDKNYQDNLGLTIHGIDGTMVIPLLALALFISGIVLRKVDGALRWASIVFGLVILQVVLAMISFGIPIVGLLHGTNALLILLSALKASTVTRTRVDAAVTQSAVTVG